MKRLCAWFGIVVCFCGWAAGDQMIDAKMHHLRAGEVREWDDFPEKAEGDRLAVKFEAKANETEYCLRLRQRDLRYNWKILLNGKQIAKLEPDDSEIVSVVAVPPRALKDGENELQVINMGPAARAGVHVQSDDVMIGRFELIERARKDVLQECAVKVQVNQSRGNQAIPARITIVDEQGGLAATGTEMAEHLAIRPGIVYTSTGRAEVKLPAGRYTFYAGRGFEWSVDKKVVEVKAGRTTSLEMSIGREVDTAGYVSSDTHMHTATYARHGDATMAERMITLAAEGIEMPVSTEHNLQIDFEKPAEEAHVRSYFTPVLGNELTTAKLGHFNIFPIDKAAKLIYFQAPTWQKLFASANEIAPGNVSILNHGRDIHAGFRPFDPSHHISLTGEATLDWLPPIHAMEVINSGATLAEPMQLFVDWFGLLNRGMRIAPAGGSDSHDVSRYIVGQARTYIRCGDADPASVDVAKACEAIKRGRVLVSYGLLVDMKVNGKFPSGDLAKVDGDAIEAKITVQGPAWTKARQVELYANGIKVSEIQIEPKQGARAGVKWERTVRIPRPGHDVWLVAIARGPGIEGLFWPIARPYQPTSTHWVPYVMGCTGAVFVDVDGSGKFESAYEYAQRIVKECGGDAAKAIEALKGYDASVALQTASILRKQAGVDTPEKLVELVKDAPAVVKKAFGEYAAAWKEAIEAGRVKVKS